MNAVTPIELRDYQLESVQQLRDAIAAGKRHLILSAPTGSGKSECAAHMIQQAVRKGTRSLFIVDRIVLADQTSARFDKYGIEHGIIQAGHPRWRPYEPVQICSAQTLERRGIPEGVGLVFVDESHVCRRKISEFVKDTSAVVIGLTATPFTKGLANLYSGIVNVTTTDKLMAEGHLKPLRYYAASATIDTKGMKVIAGEWSEAEIEQRGQVIIGDIVQGWAEQTMRHFGEPRKTLVFSATVAHGEELARAYRDAGFNFLQLSYLDTNDARSREIMADFSRPDTSIQGLISCEKLTKGVDIPDVQIGVSARPYRKSLSSHIQQLGRVMRKFPGHEYGLFLDNSGNCMRFHDATMEFFANGIHELDDGEHDAHVHQEPDEKKKAEIRCSCGCILRPVDDACPGCGKERIRRALVKVAAGELQEISSARVRNVTMETKVQFFGELRSYAEAHNFNSGWAAHKYREKFGVWPNDPRVKNAPRLPVSEATRGFIVSRQIAWSKRRKTA